MNTNPTSVFARKLFHSPDMLNGDLDAELVEQIRRFAKGDLSDDDAAIIAELIHDDPGVADCYHETLKLMHEAPFTRAPVGKSICAAIAEDWNDLCAAISDLFTSKLATASGEEGLERMIDDGKTLVELRPDSAGRLWLQVTSKSEKYRGGTFKFEVESGPSLLRFAEVKPGVYSAQVCVEPEVAARLAQGATPVFTPAESTKTDSSE